MASERQRLIDWFYRVPLILGECDFDSLLATAAMEALGKDAIEAEAYVATNAPRIWAALLSAIDAEQRSGMFRLLQYRDPARRTLTCGADRLPAGDQRKQVRAFGRPWLMRAIDAFSDREYEALGCVIAELGGADRVKLTPPGNEGGVDFFARVRQPGFCHVFSGAAVPLRLIGQCKKYSSPVGLDRMRDFITTMEQIRHGSAFVEKHVPAWFRDSTGPVVGWVIAHAGFQSGARTLARNHGVLISTSLDIAEIGAMSRRVPEHLSVPDRVKYLVDLVTSFLSTWSASAAT